MVRLKYVGGQVAAFPREDYSQEPAAAFTNIVELQLLIFIFFIFFHFVRLVFVLAWFERVLQKK
jgi:hypothetical protein